MNLNIEIHLNLYSNYICILKLKVTMKRTTYTKEAMDNALDVIKNGMSKHKASLIFNIPRSTLIDNSKPYVINL